MNRLNIQEEPIVITGTTVLGYAPGQTLPSRLIICTTTGAATVTLPPILTSQATTLPGAVTEGSGALVLSIYTTATQTITVAAATGDALAPAAPTIATAGDKATLIADPATRKWYVVG